MGKKKSEPALAAAGGQTIKIYGASDDLVEVEGDVPGCNEFNTIDAPLYIELATGDLFKALYTERGVWVVTHENKSGLVKVHHEPHGEGDDPDPYTETVTATAPQIGWVEVWKEYPPTVEEMKEKMGRALAQGDDTIDRDRILADDEVRAVWAVVAPALRRLP